MVSKKNIHINSHKTLKKRKSKKFYGGLVPVKNEIDSKIKQNKIENVEIIWFLIDFLNKPELKNILLENYKFINGIDIENNMDQSFDFEKNPEFRKFVSDVVQWFLLDYNKQFANSILGILKNTLIDADFLNKTIDINERYNILLLNFCDMIDNFKGDSQENLEISSLLKIILKVLTMKSLKEDITSFITLQQDNIISVKKSVICLLDNLMKKDLLHDEKIRGLLKEYIEQLTYKTVFDWSNLKKLSGLIGNCVASLTAEVGTITAKSAYKKTIGWFYKSP